MAIDFQCTRYRRTLLSWGDLSARGGPKVFTMTHVDILHRQRAYWVQWGERCRMYRKHGQVTKIYSTRIVVEKSKIWIPHIIIKSNDECSHSTQVCSGSLCSFLCWIRSVREMCAWNDSPGIVRGPPWSPAAPQSKSFGDSRYLFNAFWCAFSSNQLNIKLMRSVSRKRFSGCSSSNFSELFTEVLSWERKISQKIIRGEPKERGDALEANAWELNFLNFNIV